MKYLLTEYNTVTGLSLPVRGAWIEIDKHAVRTSGCAGRSPCGERGLKFTEYNTLTGLELSLPVRGAWIEILLDYIPPLTLRSLPVRGAWIEMLFMPMRIRKHKSLPVRGAWIEIIRRPFVKLP